MWDYDINKYVKTRNLIWIDDDAFKSHNITKLKLPSTLESIGKNAFANNNIKRVEFYNTKVNYIGEYAFYNNNISAIVWNKFIKQINRYVFAKNSLSNGEFLFGNCNIETICEFAFAYNKFWIFAYDSKTNKLLRYRRDSVVSLPLTLKTIYTSSFEIDQKILYKPEESIKTKIILVYTRKQL